MTTNDECGGMARTNGEERSPFALSLSKDGMSVFYNAYFIKTREPESALKQQFGRAQIMPDSEWIICDFGDGYPNGLFEAGAYFTKEASSRFGEAMFICVDTRNNQFEYEHSIAGKILRKLCWLSDGCQSTWAWVEGEPEEWEATVVFSEANFARARELLRYDEQLAELHEEAFLTKERELRAMWEQQTYALGTQWPLADSTIGMAIQKHFGIKLPPQ